MFVSHKEKSKTRKLESKLHTLFFLHYMECIYVRSLCTQHVETQARSDHDEAHGPGTVGPAL